MRLTLRTMLAYMDDVLDPADAVELRKKIEESDFASGLVDRVHGVLKKLRLDAPKLDGKGMGNDANTVSDYLDSALEQDRTAEFERVCLESDKHLCEVAACHQILTIVLGKPADVPPELRERIYALGDPEKATVHLAGAAAAPSHEARAGAPAPARNNGRHVKKAAPLEVPEYLRGSRQQSLWPLVGMMAAALILALVALRAMGPFDDSHPLYKWLNGGQQIAQTTEENAQSPDENAAQSGTPAPDAAATVANADAAVPASDASPTPGENPSPANVATTDVPPPPPTVPAENAVVTAPPAAATTPAANDAPAPATSVPPVPVPPSPAPPPAIAVIPMLPKPKGPAEPPKPKPVEVGRYTSDGQLIATLDPDDGLWYAKQSQEILTAGERLVVLPPYRPQIALPSAVQLSFAGEGSLHMDEPDENRTPRVTVKYGRFLVATAGKAGAQVQLDLAGITGLLTLVDADSELAIKVARWVPPGLDPEVAENGSIVVEMYNRNGRASWQPADQPNVEIPARFVYVHYADLPPETHGPFYPPEWIDAKNIKPIDADAANKLQKMLDVERPLVLSLQEAMKDRRVEVRSLSARCLSVLGEFEPVLHELSDPNQYSFWQGEFDALRHGLARSPQAAAKIRETINLARSADAADLYRLLWSYNDDQLAKGAAGQLVKYLDHDQLDIRVLAYVNLVSITGVFGTYRPERPVPQRKTAVTDWGKRRDKGAILHKSPLSPLDLYKPIAAAGGDAKDGAAAGGTAVK